VAAAIPSGVGFLGAGMIWKQAASDTDGYNAQTVHGLTTAASLWLSAAVGIASGGAVQGGQLLARQSRRLLEATSSPCPSSPTSSDPAC